MARHKRKQADLTSHLIFIIRQMKLRNTSYNFNALMFKLYYTSV